MPKKKQEFEKELPDETMEKVSGGWIVTGEGLSYIYYAACQLYPDDIFAQHYYEGANCTCPGVATGVNVKQCSSCVNFLYDPTPKNG